jgi:hypothetical protein
MWFGRLSVLTVACLISCSSTTKQSTMVTPHTMIGSTHVFTIDYGTTTKGDRLEAWVVIKNVDRMSAHITEDHHAGWESRSPMLDVVLKPGYEVLHELPQFSTTGFSGPIRKALNFKCEPPTKLRVTLYQSRPSIKGEAEKPHA